MIGAQFQLKPETNSCTQSAAPPAAILFAAILRRRLQRHHPRFSPGVSISGTPRASRLCWTDVVGRLDAVPLRSTSMRLTYSCLPIVILFAISLPALLAAGPVEKDLREVVSNYSADRGDLVRSTMCLIRPTAWSGSSSSSASGKTSSPKFPSTI